MVETLEQCIILSIGVSEYRSEALEDSLPSAIFDSILVANRFESRGFTKMVLANPDKQQLMKSIRDLRSNIEE